MNKEFCIIDIAQVVDWKDVKRSRDYYYPTDHNNYAPVLRAINERIDIRIYGDI